MINSKKKSIVILGVILVVFVVMFFGAARFSQFSVLGVSENQWSVVYLTTGEVYISKVSQSQFCPWKEVQLSDSYLLQVVQTPVLPAEGEELTEEQVLQTETNFQLTPINEALWAPEKLYVNKEQIVFYGAVLETSRVAEAIKEAGKW